MGQREHETEELEAQRLRATQKVEGQREVVARLNGSAADHPQEQHLLREMQHNKAAIDFNCALFDYGQDSDKHEAPERKPPSP